MRGSLYFLLCFTVFFVSCAKIDFPVGATIPRLEFYTLESGELELLEFYKGENIELLFWRTDCRHSVKRLEELDSEPSGSLKLAVSLDILDNRDKVVQIAKKFKNAKHYFSGNSVWDQAWVSLRGLAVPALLEISPDLRLLRVE
ncbi:MAG: hypothetical protein NZO16_02875 [Deltaproteobacteria bacterium]|nr:hypothetical protein [Deltaproteobacteria bacterium]